MSRSRLWRVKWATALILHLRGFASILTLEYPIIAKGVKYLASPDARIQESTVAPHCASERQSLVKSYIEGPCAWQVAANLRR